MEIKIKPVKERKYGKIYDPKCNKNNMHVKLHELNFSDFKEINKIENMTDYYGNPLYNNIMYCKHNFGVNFLSDIHAIYHKEVFDFIKDFCIKINGSYGKIKNKRIISFGVVKGERTNIIITREGVKFRRKYRYTI